MIGAARARSAPGNPFPGLRPFRDSEEHLFFGRESQVDTMIDKLARKRFLAIVGISGSGKSSLVNCGLRPALHRGLMARAGTSWRMAQFRPGSDPVRSMARALAVEGVLFGRCEMAGLSLADMVEASLRMSKLGLADVYEQAQPGDGVNLLVVVDQFEELFRYRTPGLDAGDSANDRGQEARAFVNLLLEAHAQTSFPIYVAITMRSDFLGDCAEFTGLPEAINQGQYLVPRLTREERRAAVAGPVAVGGAEISPVLLTRLVNDVGDNPDQLSILQHALNRTWARWDSEGGVGPLELGHYEAIGTMANALDRHAEKAYSELQTESQRKICEKIFKALTDWGTDSRGTRRPVALSVLCSLAAATPAEVTQVIDVFRKPSRSFLMPPLPETVESCTVIDISHESLMRVWERLRHWADEEARSARFYRRLTETAALHAAGNTGLWRDPELQLALDWRVRERPVKAWADLYGGGFEGAMGFLAASEAEREAEKREKEEIQKRELERAQALSREKARTARRLVWLIAAITLLLLVAVGFGASAWTLRNRAEAQRTIAEYKGKIADEQSEIAKQETIEAARQTAKANIAGLLRLQADREAKLDTKKKNEADSWRLATTATESIPGERAVDPERAVLLALEAARANLTPEAQNALRRAVEEDRIQLSKNAPEGKSPAVAFSSDGKRLAALSTATPPSRGGGGERGGAELWDIESRDLLALSTGGIASFASSPDGKYLATSGPDAPTEIHIWVLATGKPACNPLEQKSAVTAMAFSGDGSYLAAASQDKNIGVWSVPGGASPKRIMQTGEMVNALAFSTDGKRLAASDRQTTRIWDVDVVGSKPQEISATGVVSSIARNGDGSYLVTLVQPVAGAGAKVTLYEVPAQGPVTAIPTLSPTGVIASETSVSPDGTLLVLTVTAGGEADVWRASDRKYTQIADHGVSSAAFSHDGRQLAAAYSDKHIEIWDVKTSKSLFALAGNQSGVTGMVFSPDAKRLSTLARDGTIRVWSTNPRDVLKEFTGHGAPVYRLAFNAKGTQLVTASADNNATVWDAGGNELRKLGHDGYVRGVAFSPDGSRIATSSVDKTVKVWDEGSGKELFTLKHDDQVMAVAFSPNGKRLATASWDRTARVWDAATGLELLRLAHSDRVEHIAFSPDGRWLATAADDQSGRIWNAETGKQRLVLSGHSSWVLGVAFSPDGRQLATAGADSAAFIWDLSTGKQIRKLSGHGGAIQNIAYSPDGRLIATASDDNTARVWDAGTGDALSTLTGHWGAVYGIAFSPDGSHVATAGADGRILVRPVRTKDLIDLAQRVVSRGPLTAVECGGYRVESHACQIAVTIQKARDMAQAENVTGAIAEAQKLDPGLRPDRRELRGLAASSKVATGLIMAKQGDWKNAARKFREAQELDPVAKPDALKPYRQAAQSLVDGAREAAAQGDLDGAIAKVAYAQKLDAGVAKPDREELSKLAGKHWLAEGRVLAKEVDREGYKDRALEAFRKAKDLDTSLKLDPEAEENRILAPILFEKGTKVLRRNQPLSEADFKVAVEAITSAIGAYEASGIDPDGRVRAGDWNDLCWLGSVRGHAADMRETCEKAVKLCEPFHPEQENARDSRGVSRALTGDDAGAIADFQYFILHTTDEQHKRERQGWVDAYGKGQNPFTPELIRLLISQ